MGVVGRGGALDMGSAPRDKLWIRPLVAVALEAKLPQRDPEAEALVVMGS